MPTTTNCWGCGHRVTTGATKFKKLGVKVCASCAPTVREFATTPRNYQARSLVLQQLRARLASLLTVTSTGGPHVAPLAD
jgi:hypothetical protein